MHADTEKLIDSTLNGEISHAVEMLFVVPVSFQYLHHLLSFDVDSYKIDVSKD